MPGAWMLSGACIRGSTGRRGDATRPGPGSAAMTSTTRTRRLRTHSGVNTSSRGRRSLRVPFPGRGRATDADWREPPRPWLEAADELADDARAEHVGHPEDLGVHLVVGG